MHDKVSQEIHQRFFEALNTIVTCRRIAGKATFCRELGINRQNFWTIEKNPATHSIKLSWIAHLVTHHEVSAHWIMTGQGKMLDARKRVIL
ncbi:MAG: hypothetical protein ACRCZB_08100 [Bacteroidales bacterium]